jgi:hypothetical protein
MVPPRVAVKDGVGGRRLARSFYRSMAIERLVNAMLVVISPELLRFSLQVNGVPDQHVIKKLRRIVPISRSTNGWDTGTYGLDLISSTSRMRKLASQ